MPTDNPVDIDKDLDDLDLGLDEVEVQTDFDPIPEGEYELKVERVSLKENSRGTGYLLKFMFAIEAPDQVGRTVWSDNMNIIHQNDQAEEIGKQQYKRFLLATGRDAEPDSFEGHIGDRVIGTVRHEEYRSNGEQRTAEKVKRFEPTKGNTPQGAFEEPEEEDSSDSSFDDVPF